MRPVFLLFSMAVRPFAASVPPICPLLASNSGHWEYVPLISVHAKFTVANGTLVHALTLYLEHRHIGCGLRITPYVRSRRRFFQPGDGFLPRVSR
jgi:hypothetical protein